MDKPAEKRSLAPASPSAPFIRAGFAVIDAVGRRGAHVYGLSREQVGMVAYIIIFIGIPFLILLSVMPVWEWVGELRFVSKVNSYIAPGINGFDDHYRAAALPQFPRRRFLIAATSTTELLFLANFASMFFRRIRKHALLVWICFDREKLLSFLAVSGLVFASLWYVFFYDWRALYFLATRTRLTIVAAWSIPAATLLFGHLAAICVLGICRSSRKTAQFLWRRYWDANVPRRELMSS